MVNCGECSPAPSLRIVDMLAATLLRAWIERIKEAGHMLPLTHADQVTDFFPIGSRFYWRRCGH